VTDDVMLITVAWTADAAGAVTSTVLTPEIDGYVFLAVTNPGAVSPTDNYDVTLTDTDGVDVMGGTLANRDAVNSEAAVPLIATGTYDARFVDGGLTFDLTNNSVNSAGGVLKVYYYRYKAVRRR